MPEQPTYILNDKAVESLKEDALDFTPYVQALADIIMTGSTPLTIGVFGTWGSGKTSLMKMVKEQVEAKGAVAGWFDAWKYDKEETLWRAFLLSVLFALEDAAKKNNQPTDEIEKLKTLLYQPMDIEKTGGVTIDLAKLTGKLAQGAVQVSLSFIPGGAALGKIIEELQKSGTANLTDGALDAIQRERTKIHIEQIHFLEQFQERFRKIVAESVVRNKDGRLVIFVDDLDRCLPEKAIEVLEAIKLFVDAPGCVFMLGLDQEVIARGIELKYREDGPREGENHLSIDGMHYLEKIIQVPFHIPPIEKDDMSEFIYSLRISWPDEECPNIFSVSFHNNPRQIKRAANIFLLAWNLAQRREQNLIQPIRLAKIITIQAIYPELYNLIKSHPIYLQKLEKHCRTHPIDDEKLSTEGVNETKDTIAIHLPPALAKYSSLPMIRPILCMHNLEKLNANFIELDADEISIYFTLTRGVESPKFVSQEQREGERYGDVATELIRIPIAGRIVAGVPAPVPPSDWAYYDAEASLDIARSLLPIQGKTDGLYALEIKGDSMSDAMVNDGDYVIMKAVGKNSEVRNGEMVAVWLPTRDETTLKYFYKEKDGYRLQPANPTMKPIMIKSTEPIEIKGKVIMVIRKVTSTAM